MRGARVWQETFDPDVEYEANKYFKFGDDGREFNPGDPFDVDTSPRMMRILYDSRFIRRVEAESPPQKTESGPVEPTADPDTSEEVRKPEVVQKGGGWYDVLGPDGTKLNEKSLRIEDANKLAEEASNGMDLRRGSDE